MVGKVRRQSNEVGDANRWGQIELKIVCMGLGLGSYHFLPGEGPSVCDGQSPIFSGPPFAYGKKFWSPLCVRRKILVPPFGPPL